MDDGTTFERLLLSVATMFIWLVHAMLNVKPGFQPAAV